MYSCMIQLKSRFLPGFSREGITVYETPRFDLVTFLRYPFPPHSLDFWRGKHRAGPLARCAGSCSGQHQWLASLGRRHGSEACGRLLVEMWSKKHQGGHLFQEPGQSLVWRDLSQGRGAVSCGMSCWLNCTHLPLALAVLLSNFSSLLSSLTAQGCGGLERGKGPKREPGSGQ